MIWSAAIGLFLLHALLMLVDELHYHRRRGLPLWERLGHPADTLTVLACYALALWIPYSPRHLPWFAGLALFSCLFITKDEWVHARLCTGGEGWLHAMLFGLHPVLLVMIGLYWAWEGGAGPVELAGTRDWPAETAAGMSRDAAPSWTPVPPAAAEARAWTPGGPEWRAFRNFIPWQAGLTAAFGIYQLVYWNWPWKKTPPSPPGQAARRRRRIPAGG